MRPARRGATDSDSSGVRIRPDFETNKKRSQALFDDYLRDTTSIGPETSCNEGLFLDEDDMTVGIGVLCDDAETIILAADMRATYRGMAVDPHDRTGKLYDFCPFNLAAAIAGSTSSTHAIISELSENLKGMIKAKLEQPGRHIFLEHIRDALEYSRKKEMRRLQDCEMESQLHCSANDWLSGKLPTGELMNEYAHKWGVQVLKSVKEDFRKKAAVIVAGFLATGPVFLRGIGFDPVEDAASPAVYVIGGKGAVEAFQVLIERQQNVEMGIARSIFHVYEAMKAAKIDEGVGEPASYVVMRSWTAARPQGMLRFKPDHPILKQWSKTYHRDSSPLESRAANDLIYRAFNKARIRDSRMLGPKNLIGEL